MEYKILSHEDPTVLSQMVTAEFANGWKPQGGVDSSSECGCETYYGTDFEGRLFSQAMIKCGCKRPRRRNQNN